MKVIYSVEGNHIVLGKQTMAAAPQQSSTIRGKVIDTNGDPVFLLILTLAFCECVFSAKVQNTHTKSRNVVILIILKIFKGRGAR